MPYVSAPGVQAAIERGQQLKDRAHMQPMTEYFVALAAEHPDDPFVTYELAGCYDTAGEEERAKPLYEKAIADGLHGDALRRCLLQYGSTLRNLEQYDASLEVFARARAEFPASDSIRLFQALSLHAAGRSDAAVGELLAFAADRIATPEVQRYEAALRGNAEYLLALDAGRS